MKSTAFNDRARQLASWFQEMNQCEQTIALYMLLSKVTATQARFFSLFLEHTLKNNSDAQELSKMEDEANNPAFLSAIHSESDTLALQNLLLHLPLLHPGNSEAREEYLKLLPKVLLGSGDDTEYLYKCRQLLSLALVHPAFPYKDREKLGFWQSRLNDKCRNLSTERINSSGSNTLGPHHHSPHSYTSQYTSSTLPHSSPRRIYQINTGPSDGDGMNSRSGTLNGSSRIYITMPPGPAQGFPLNGFDPMGEVDTYPYDDDDEPQRAFTLTTGPPPEHCHTPVGYDDYIKHHRKTALSLPVQRSTSTCSLPASLDDNSTPIYWKDGMKNIPVWLKSLRLHKYQKIFIDSTYEELLNMTEKFLESKSITKGARTKIINSIKKLNQRSETLAEIDQEIEKPGKLMDCIESLKHMLVTPIKPYDTDLPEDSATVSETTPDSLVHKKEDSLNNSPRHHRALDEVASSEESTCSTPPSSPRLHRSSSISSIDDLLAKDFPQEDLPSLLTKTIGKVFSQLMMHTDTNEENLSAFIKLLDSALSQEFFKVSHKKLFFDWLQQCQQTLRVISPKKSPRKKGWPQSYTIGSASHRSSSSTFSSDKRSTTKRSTSKSSTMCAKTTVSLLGSPRSPTTLPRFTPSQIHRPFPPPYYPPRKRSGSVNSGVYATPPAATPLPVPSLVKQKSHKYVNLAVPSPSEVSEVYMDELCESVTNIAIEES